MGNALGRMEASLSYAHTVVLPCIFGATLLLWNTFLLRPLRTFAVALHEFSHGVAILLTCGYIHDVTVTPGEGGAIAWFAFCSWAGSDALILASGYLGPSLLGCLFMWLATFGEGRRIGLVCLAGLLSSATSTVARQRLRWFALVYSLLAAACVAAALGGDAAALLAWSMLATCSTVLCTYAAWDVFDDGVRRQVDETDMSRFAQRFGGSSLEVAIAWLLLCVLFPVATWMGLTAMLVG
jgi:hypothetical protein